MKVVTRILTLFLITLPFLPAPAHAAKWSADLGIYSKYISGSGTVHDNGPVWQGDLKVMSDLGIYGEVWLSQSLTCWQCSGDGGNEAKFIGGWAGHIVGPLSGDLHFAYQDESKPRLSDFGKGNQFAQVGTLRLGITDTTSAYVHGENDRTVGSHGANGGHFGIGLTTAAFGAKIDLSAHRDYPSHYNFAKLYLSPVDPWGHLGGAALRPIVYGVLPFGPHDHDVFGANAVVGIKLTWK